MFDDGWTAISCTSANECCPPGRDQGRRIRCVYTIGNTITTPPTDNTIRVHQDRPSDLPWPFTPDYPLELLLRPKHLLHLGAILHDLRLQGQQPYAPRWPDRRLDRNIHWPQGRRLERTTVRRCHPRSDRQRGLQRKSLGHLHRGDTGHSATRPHCPRRGFPTGTQTRRPSHGRHGEETPRLRHLASHRAKRRRHLRGQRLRRRLPELRDRRRRPPRQHQIHHLVPRPKHPHHRIRRQDAPLVRPPLLILTHRHFPARRPAHILRT